MAWFAAAGKVAAQLLPALVGTTPQDGGANGNTGSGGLLGGVFNQLLGMFGLGGNNRTSRPGYERPLTAWEDWFSFKKTQGRYFLLDKAGNTETDYKKVFGTIFGVGAILYLVSQRFKRFINRLIH